jgi:hypothetical protein
MKNFALINEDNLVVNISIGNDDWDSTGWIEIKPENPTGIGFTYDAVRDTFIAPKPECHPDLIVFDEETCTWSCPDASHVLILGE